MKIIPKTKKDFEWVNWGPKDFEREIKKTIEKLKEDYEKIKSIAKKDRTFENTIFAIASAGRLGYDAPIGFHKYVNPKKTVRDASSKWDVWGDQQVLKISNDPEIYNAFNEYNPRKEKLSDEEKLLYKKMKIGFEAKGFHLPEKKRNRLVEINERLMKIENDFSNNLANYEDHILCTKEELSGLSDNYIANLKKDKKTGKYIVSLAYPEINPFMGLADSEKKRKQLGEKRGKKGGMKNVKIIKEMLTLRHEKAKILGYKSFADFATSDRISGSSKKVMDFLVTNLKKMKPEVKKDFKKKEAFAKKEMGIDKITFYNNGYITNKYKKHLFDYDPNETKQYFPMDNVMKYMFSHFGKLFGVSFRKNPLKLWHKDVLFFDVVEKGKRIGHIAFDLYPRKGKYGHMACWNLVRGRDVSFRSKEYKTPVSVIVGNFPKGTKKNPSLLSIREIETLFHEFGHMSHNYLTRAHISAFAGTRTDEEFVEMPSQMFENWIKERSILKEMSSHYKTSEKIPDSILDKIDAMEDFMKSGQYYGSFMLSVVDILMHSTHYKKDSRETNKIIDKKYGFVEMDKKSLFPASLGHIAGGYEAGMYTYMWSLVYAYDVYSRFKKEGIKSKKVGKDLREKILSKGGSVDEMKQMKDFLGRKPNNKAFLEALGIK